jgi:DNA modification methylase
VAAEILDRRWIGIELSENYAEIASKRIQAFVDDKRQQKLEFENGGE